MSNWRGFVEGLHLSSLGLWAGSVIMSAATAAIAFPTMKQMGVRVPEITPAFEGDSYRFAAGAVAAKVFLVSDIVAFACACTAALTMLVMIVFFKSLPKRMATIVRSIGLSVAMASLAAILFVVTPQINTAARLHKEAAKTNDVAAAAVHRKAVDDLHPMSSVLLSVEVCAVLLALFGGAWSLATPPRIRVEKPLSGIEEPSLAKKRRA